MQTSIAFRQYQVHNAKEILQWSIDMGKKILIVDDTKFMRMLLKSILLPIGYEIVDEAEDGVQAIEKYRKHKPDLITMDIIMPNLNGIDALKAIMRDFPDASAIMVTAVGQEKMVKQAMAAGAKGYIVKPFKAPRILKVISDVLSEGGMQDRQ